MRHQSIILGIIVTTLGAVFWWQLAKELWALTDHIAIILTNVSTR